jgi:AraC-like DNA-binding protein
MNHAFFGRRYRGGHTVLPRHRHAPSYAALVLSGGYEEAGDRGRLRAQAGDIVLHGAFEAHLNRYDSPGSEVLSLALPALMEPVANLLQAADPEMIVRLAERDAREAVAFLLETSKPLPCRIADWPDELAHALAHDPHLRLQDWACEQGLADATVSRGFRQVFGISPSAYRAQIRGRMAWQRSSGSTDQLASVALDSGFCDQAHMTRTVRDLTGQTPGAWRRQVK